MDISEHDTRNAKVVSEFEFHFSPQVSAMLAEGWLHGMRLDIFIQMYAGSTH